MTSSIGEAGDDKGCPADIECGLFGGDGNDEIHGGEGLDLIYGEAGEDRLFGESEQDTIYGGSGNDHIDGGQGDDRGCGATVECGLFGGDGNDKIYGGPGMDLMFGNAGEDNCFGGQGEDECDGGDANPADPTQDPDICDNDVESKLNCRLKGVPRIIEGTYTARHTVKKLKEEHVGRVRFVWNEERGAHIAESASDTWSMTGETESCQLSGGGVTPLKLETSDWVIKVDKDGETFRYTATLAPQAQLLTVQEVCSYGTGASMYMLLGAPFQAMPPQGQYEIVKKTRTMDFSGSVTRNDLSGSGAQWSWTWDFRGMGGIITR